MPRDARTRLVERIAGEPSGADDAIQLLSAVLDHESLGVAVLREQDGDLVYVYVNPAFQALRPGSPMDGRTVREVWSGAADEIEAQLRGVLASGRPWTARDAPFVLHDAAGGDRTWRFTFEMSVLEAAGQRYLLETVDTAAEVAARYRMLVEATSDVVYRMSPDWRELRELRGRGFMADTLTPTADWIERYVPEDDRPALRAAVGRALRTKGVFELEHRIIRPDGTLGWALSRAVPVTGADGAIAEWFGTLRDVTERRRLEERTAEAQERVRRELQRTTILKETAAATLVLDAEEVAKRALETLRTNLGMRAGVLYLLDEDGAALRNLAIVGYDPAVRHLFDRVPLDEESVSGRSVLADELLVFRFAELPPATRRRAMSAGERDSTWAVVPVRSAGRPIGNLTLVFDAERVVTDEDVSLFRALADQLGIAITNATLYEREREAARLGAVLARIDHDVHSTLRVDELVASALSRGAEAIGAASAAVDGITDDGWVAWYDWGFAESIVGHTYTDEQNPHGVQAVRAAETIAIEDAYSDPRVDNETMKAYGLRSAIVAPLIVRGQPIAALYYNYHDDIHRFTSSQVDFVRKVAGSLSLAIENARLHAAEADSARLGRSLVAIHAELASSLDVDESLPLVLRTLCDEMAASGAAVQDRLEGGWRVRHLIGLAGSGLAAGDFLPDEEAPTSTWVAREREPFVVEDVREAEEVNVRLAERAGYRAYTLHPLIARGEVTGTLTVFFTGPRPLSDAERDYLGRVAFAVSLSEETSRLYEAEHRIAETLQTALLALPEQVEGIEFGHLYRSATEAARVGGDFYDLFEVEDGRIGVTIGDISGHGVEAASLTSLVKNAIRVQAMQRQRPCRVMEVANEILFRNSTSEIFATVFFGVLSTADGSFEYCNAGHPPGAILHGDCAAEWLHANSPLIGAISGLAFADATTRLEPGASLLLYTDGLTEAREAGGELFGEDRVMSVLLAECERPPDEVIRHIVDAAVAHAGGTLSDDLAILALRACGGPGRA